MSGSTGENEQRRQIVAAGRMLHRLGLAHGATGNISVRLPDGMLVTPTGSRLGDLTPAEISRLDERGELRSGRPPSKEATLHRGVYRARPDMRAVVHLHAPHSVAVSCLADLDPRDALPPLTAYHLMRVGAVPLLPFFPPGSVDLADAVAEAAATHHAMLLANHGSLAAGDSLDGALGVAEELEATASLYLMLRGQPVRLVPARYRAELG